MSFSISAYEAGSASKIEQNNTPTWKTQSGSSIQIGTRLKMTHPHTNMAGNGIPLGDFSILGAPLQRFLNICEAFLVVTDKPFRETNSYL